MAKTVTITIPKALAQKGELVIVPRKEYEKLLQRQKKIPIVHLTLSEKKDLELARKELKKGQYVTLEEIEHELGIAS